MAAGSTEQLFVVTCQLRIDRGFGVLYLLVRRLCLGYLMIPGSGIEVGSSLQHLATVFRSLGEYLLLAVWPFTSITPIHHADLPIDILHPGRVGSLVVGCGVLFLLWKSRRSVPGSYFLAAMVTLLPVINILPWISPAAPSSPIDS